MILKVYYSTMVMQQQLLAMHERMQQYYRALYALEELSKSSNADNRHAILFSCPLQARHQELEGAYDQAIDIRDNTQPPEVARAEINAIFQATFARQMEPINETRSLIINRSAAMDVQGHQPSELGKRSRSAPAQSAKRIKTRR